MTDISPWILHHHCYVFPMPATHSHAAGPNYKASTGDPNTNASTLFRTQRKAGIVHSFLACAASTFGTPLILSNAHHCLIPPTPRNPLRDLKRPLVCLQQLTAPPWDRVHPAVNCSKHEFAQRSGRTVHIARGYTPKSCLLYVSKRRRDGGGEVTSQVGENEYIYIWQNQQL